MFFLSVHFYLDDVLNCDQWTSNKMKVVTLHNVILKYIRNQCACNFSESQIKNTYLMCENNTSTYVIVTYQILANYVFNVSQLMAILERLPQIISSLVIQGETLHINNDCFAVSTFLNLSECYPSARQTEVSSISSKFTETSSNGMSQNNKQFTLILSVTIAFVLAIIVLLGLFIVVYIFFIKYVFNDRNCSIVFPKFTTNVLYPYCTQKLSFHKKMHA